MNKNQLPIDIEGGRLLVARLNAFRDRPPLPLKDSALSNQIGNKEKSILDCWNSV